MKCLSLAPVSLIQCHSRDHTRVYNLVKSRPAFIHLSSSLLKNLQTCQPRGLLTSAMVLWGPFQLWTSHGVK
jgi:hypothetical protein